MFQPDEEAIRVPQESGADVWQNGRTGETANFAVFKVNHTRDESGKVVQYQIEVQGKGTVPHPFTGEVQTHTFFLMPPPAHLLKPASPVYADYLPEQTRLKPGVTFDGRYLFGAFVFCFAVWVAIGWWIWRLIWR